MSAPTVRAPGALTPPSPRGVRAAVGRVLHTGVLASAAVLVTGYVVTFVREPATFGSQAVARAHLAARASFPHSFGAVLDGIGRGRGDAIIVAGVLMLILTPVAGLVTGAVAFARRGVLAVILGSFLLGSLAA